MNTGTPGKFEYEDLGTGFDLENHPPRRGLFGRLRIRYRFFLIPETPLTYILADRTRVRPCREFITDQGSIEILQGWFPKDASPAFYFHDDQYRTGGAWIAAPDSPAFKFVELTRAEADSLLRSGLQAGRFPLSAAKAWAIWAGVRVGGYFAWHKWKSGLAGTEELFPKPEPPETDI
jgi:hypothetical protein